MSLASLLRAGVAESARGMITRAYQLGAARLSAAALREITERLTGRLQRLSPADRANVGSIVATQDAAVRAGQKLARGERIDGRSVPVSPTADDRFKGKRWRVTAVASYPDLRTGQRVDQVYVLTTDSVPTLEAVTTVIETDQGVYDVEKNESGPSRALIDNERPNIRIISVERSS